MAASTKPGIGAVAYAGGVTFRVWAPFANAVAVTGDFNQWGQFALESESNGYWSADVEGAKPGSQYKFVITAGDKTLLKNDPRALAVSKTAVNSVVEDASFDWGLADFKLAPIHQLVIYELHIGTFNREDVAMPGTFASAIKKLDYLANLGINAIQIMPCTEFLSELSWGYNPAFPYAVESSYGGRRALQEFVKAAHAKKIGVILDVVYNHFGPGNIDLWQFDGWSEHEKGGIYFYNDARSKTPWGDTRPDYGRHEVRDFIKDNAVMWVADCRVDGLRWDSTLYMRNVEGKNNDPQHDIPDAWRLMQEANTAVRTKRPSAILIAEDLQANTALTRPVDEGGAGFSAQWDLSFVNAVHSAVTPQDDASRDLTVVKGALALKLDTNAFTRVVYTESHDADANGHHRVPQEISPNNPADWKARKLSTLASALVLTAPGVPMIFQGQEFVEDGTFSDDNPLDWVKEKAHEGIALLYKDLIALRRNLHGTTAGLSGEGVAVCHQDDQAKIIAYHRFNHGGPHDDVVVVMNFTGKQYNGLVTFPKPGSWKTRLNSDWSGYSHDFSNALTPQAITVQSQERTAPLVIGPYSFVILSQDEEAWL